MYNLAIVCKASQYKHFYFLMKPYQPKNNQNTKKRGNTRNKMEGPTSKKTKKTTKEGEPQGEHQVPKPPPVLREAYQIRKGKDFLKGHLA
jgi:hypothetical protein